MDDRLGGVDHDRGAAQVAWAVDVPGRQADELLLTQRLRHGLCQGSAPIRRIRPFDRCDEGAVRGCTQEWAGVRIERPILEPRQPGPTGVGPRRGNAIGGRRGRYHRGRRQARDMERDGCVGRRVRRRRWWGDGRGRGLGRGLEKRRGFDGFDAFDRGDGSDIRWGVRRAPSSTSFVRDRWVWGVGVDVGPTTTGARSGRFRSVVGHASSLWLDSNRAESSTFRALPRRFGRC